MAYIGIDREIEDHWIFKDAEYFKVWFEMLLRTRYAKEPERKMIDGKLITIEYGQFIFGRVSWSERLGISEQRLRTLIKKLIKDEMIELVKVYQKCSIYFVKNYAKYNHQSNHQPNQQQQGINDDANQQSNRESTINQPSTNHQPTTQESFNHLNHLKDITTIPTITRSTKDNPFALFETHKFGKLDSMSREFIGDTIDTYSEEWTILAIKVSIKSNVAVWNYVEKILKRWKDSGHPEPWTLEKEEHQPQPKGNLRQFNRTSSEKPKIAIIQDGPKTTPLSDEKREEMRRMARMLDGKDTGTEDVRR